MARRNRKPSQKPIKELLARAGREFEPDYDKLLGASDSAHQAEIGLLDGEVVAVKPFRSKKGLTKAQNELAITSLAHELGIRTPRPKEVLSQKQLQVAFYISRYVPDLIGAHTLSYAEDPATDQGREVSLAVQSQVSALGNLHSHKITHGDPQPKNMHFVSQEALAGISPQPYLLDFENGIDHDRTNTSPDKFQEAILEDLGRFAIAIGARQYGGFDQAEAEESFRENVVEHYLRSRGGDMVDQRLRKSALIDNSLLSFQDGRANKALHQPPNLSQLAA